MTEFLGVLFTLCVVAACVVFRMVRAAFYRGGGAQHGSDGMTPDQAAEFASFQRRYLVVFLLCAFSDWLKGPYVYALYEAYGFTPAQISLLFVGGFISSLLFGTLVGSWSDLLGRRFMCLVFCGVYALSALTKPINSFTMLFIGRLLSGVATSLLFTAFESWMVSEHRSRGFPEALLTNTFSKVTLGNGIVAIAAGFVAQGAAECCGYAAPFLVAVPCLAAAALLMTPWKENYGNADNRVLDSLKDGFRAVRSDVSLLALGACESLFESTIYIWVFYWTPAVADADSKKAVPYGLLFAAYMAAFMIGGALTDLCGQFIQRLAIAIHIVAGAALAMSATFFEDKFVVFVAFVVFEGCVGVYFPTHGTIRSAHVPEATRASVMNLFRFPMNLLVVATLQLQLEPRSVLGLIAGLQLASLLCLRAFQRRVKAHAGLKSADPIC
jgi:hypothetical protein